MAKLKLQTNNYNNYVAETLAGYFITENKGHDKLFKALKNKTYN